MKPIIYFLFKEKSYLVYMYYFSHLSHFIYRVESMSDSKTVQSINSELKENVSNNEDVLLVDIRYCRGKIYKLYFDDDPSIYYIGHTIVELSRRLNQHRTLSTHNRKSKLYNAMKKHGKYKFSIILIEEFPCSNKLELVIREQYWIDLLNPPLNSAKAHAINSTYGKNISSLKNASIYKLFNINDPKDFYIGHTIKELSKRLIAHRVEAKIYNRKLSKRMREVGLENWDIILLEKYPVTNRIEILKREQYYISTLKPPLNTLAAYLTDDEKIRKEMEKKWPCKQITTCDCGLRSQKRHMNTHLKSVVHKKFMELKENKINHTEMIQEIDDDMCLICNCGVKFEIYNYTNHMNSSIHKSLMLNIKIKEIINRMNNEDVKSITSKFPKCTTKTEKDKVSCVCGDLFTSDSKYTSYGNVHIKSKKHVNFMDFVKPILLKYENDNSIYDCKNETVKTEIKDCECGSKIAKKSHIVHTRSEIHKTMLLYKNIEQKIKDLPINLINEINKKYPNRLIEIIDDHYKCVCGKQILKRSEKGSPGHYKTKHHIDSIGFINKILTEHNNGKN